VKYWSKRIVEKLLGAGTAQTRQENKEGSPLEPGLLLLRHAAAQRKASDFELQSELQRQP
jgi:hypothetical protein